MTYAVAKSLQAAVFQRLAGDPALQALVGAHVYDQVPPGPVPPLFLALGPEAVRDRSDASGRGADHDLQLSVICAAGGFAAAKAAAAAASDALLGPDLSLARGRVVFLRFLRAQARPVAGQGDGRRIDLIFRARVEDDAQPS